MAEKSDQVPKQPDNAQKRPKGKEKVQLSEQDLELKNRLEAYVQDIIQKNDKDSLEKLKTEVRTATNSMTSVPKPFKFLNESYQLLIDHYQQLEVSHDKKLLADFLSVLAMVYGKEKESLVYLQEGTMLEFKFWGHEYLSHLAKDIGNEYQNRMQNQDGADDLLNLVQEIVPYFMEHNSEHDAIDLLMEVDKLEKVADFVNSHNIMRITDYLQKMTPYCSDQEELDKVLITLYDTSLKFHQFTNALKVALRIDKPNLVEAVFEKCGDPIIQQQLAFQIARHRHIVPEGLLSEELNKIASNHHLHRFYMHLAKDLDVIEPKSPAQVYKQHLEERNTEARMESLKMNLAQTYCNAFVNAGFQIDTLMCTKAKDQDPWVNRVKQDATTAAVASIGLINLWNISAGTEAIAEYFDLTDMYTRAGACIGFGLFCAGIVDENQPAKAMLTNIIDQNCEAEVKTGAIIGLGLAYAGSGLPEYEDILLPYVQGGTRIDLAAYAALSLGLIYVGKCNINVATAISIALTEFPASELDQSISRFFAVGLGLLFLGQSEQAEAMIETLSGEFVKHKIGKYAKYTVISLSHASTGNVLKVQELLGYCSDFIKEEADAQQVALLGIALIASSEEVGQEMVVRLFQHILQYSDIAIKRAIPLAMALMNLSNPKIGVMDLLLKLAHDPDAELSYRSILCLGLVGAGTNNSRIADKLRGLAAFFMKDPNGLFLVRIAQGLLHMGKGLISLNPYYSDNFLLNKVAMAGIITLLHGCFDIQNLIMGQQHILLYYLGLAMYPRMLFTLDENLENLPVQVRVGQAVDAVGQAGKPKRITGFQTHTSPVIISTGERAELGSEEYKPVQEIVLENFVILKKNPDYVAEAEQPQPGRKKTSFNM